MKDREWKIKKPMLFAEKYGILIFPLTAGILFLLQNTSHTIAGSQIDWISQHTVLAEYFRQRFYSTHEFFPQFASELGGGQNIYNFAYYGLYSPLVLLSYAFPFLSMEVWFQIMGILTHTADGVLCFFWLNRHLKKPYSICGAMVLMCSSAVVYHTYAQVMFVDYLPFLLLMLIGVDTCRKTKGKVLLIIGAMGTVLTSFYFAPAAFTAVGIYVLCGTKIESTGKGTGRLKSVLLFLKDCLWQLFPVFYGIVLSAFYLCPVLCTLAGGRSGGKDIQAADLFVPDVMVGKYLYKPYGLGMTAIAVMAVCMWIIRTVETGSSPGCDLSPASIPLAFKRRAVCKKQSLPAIPAVGMFPDSSISRNAVGSESDILRKTTSYWLCGGCSCAALWSCWILQGRTVSFGLRSGDDRCRSAFYWYRIEFPFYEKRETNKE